MQQGFSLAQFTCLHRVLESNFRLPQLRLAVWPTISYTLYVYIRVISEGIWLSGKTLDCRPRDCEFDPPPHSN